MNKQRILAKVDVVAHHLLLLTFKTKKAPLKGAFLLLERAMGFGPTTSTLARLRSTPELYPHLLRCAILIAHNFYFASIIFIFLCIFIFQPKFADQDCLIWYQQR